MRTGSDRQPRIDKSDAAVLEVLAIAGGQRGIVDSADCSDLRIEPVDWQSQQVAAIDKRRVGNRGFAAEGEHVILKRCEDFR